MILVSSRFTNLQQGFLKAQSYTSQLEVKYRQNIEEAFQTHKKELVIWEKQAARFKAEFEIEHRKWKEAYDKVEDIYHSFYQELLHYRDDNAIMEQNWRKQEIAAREKYEHEHQIWLERCRVIDEENNTRKAVWERACQEIEIENNSISAAWQKACHDIQAKNEVLKKRWEEQVRRAKKKNDVSKQIHSVLQDLKALKSKFEIKSPWGILLALLAFIFFPFTIYIGLVIAIVFLIQGRKPWQFPVTIQGQSGSQFIPPEPSYQPYPPEPAYREAPEKPECITKPREPHYQETPTPKLKSAPGWPTILHPVEPYDHKSEEFLAKKPSLTRPSTDVLLCWKQSIHKQSTDILEKSESPSIATETGGSIGEEDLLHEMADLGDDYYAVPNLLVKSGLDGDLILVGPDGVWLFESKYWTGTIICSKREWERQTRQGESEKIHPFDQQWLREKAAIELTLKQNGLLINKDLIKGGIVFTHEDVQLDIDDSCKVDYGSISDWTERISMENSNRFFLDDENRFAILDAILKRGSSLQPVVNPIDAASLAEDVHKALVQQIQAFIR